MAAEYDLRISDRARADLVSLLAYVALHSPSVSEIQDDTRSVSVLRVWNSRQNPEDFDL